MDLDQSTVQLLLETNRKYHLTSPGLLSSRDCEGYASHLQELRIADVAFANRLEDILSELKQKEPDRMKRLEELPDVVAVDVGSSYMPYARPLRKVLSAMNPHTRIYAVDYNPDVIANFDRDNDSGVRFVGGYAEELQKLLAGEEETRVDVLFLFNPVPTHVFPELNARDNPILNNAILIGTADGFDSQATRHYARGLTRNNFRTIITKPNPLGKLFRMYNYSPWFAAVPEAA